MTSTGVANHPVDHHTQPEHACHGVQVASSRKVQLPPSPPVTVEDASTSASASASASASPITDSVSDIQEGETSLSLIPNHRSYPLPPQPRTTGSQPVLPEDLGTPDGHVRRDPRLIRLTGAHPFNAEAPLAELWDEGFVTTGELHYVRNHGAVPRVRDADVPGWTLTVEGLVERPLTVTLRDLLAGFEQVTYPATLVCAGNRRKEQNAVARTKGFSWGAAGVSTAIWTGVPLGVLLDRAKPLMLGGRQQRGAGGGGGGRGGARYVCFEGADKLPNGYYGTSIRLDWAMDPSRGVLVAHGMNGEPLPPDHGRPLRIIIPGQIGGRSVKWLRRIVVTDAPSDNWYHIYDNRVLPTTISPEESADLPETWRDERYAIYDLNTNSVVARPAHDERSELAGEGGRGGGNFRFQGYAYSGGGRRVTRVELTLDRGRSWRLARVSYPEDEYRLAPEGEMLFGGRLDMSWRETCFCWCFWSLEVPLPDLVGEGVCTGDVMVRAMDEAMMVQPRDMYWNVLGMMNNPWYRVVIHREGDQLRFEHPTQPALIPGGWMERVKKEGGNLSNGFWGERMAGEEGEEAAPEPVKEIVMVSKDIKREISLDELRRHGYENEPWFVLNGEVYDGTKFLEGHPGGAASITGAAGQDATEEFIAIHSENAKAMMPGYHIGTLDAASKKLLESGADDDDDADADADAAGPESSSEPRPVFLDHKTWHKAPLTAKTRVSSDTKIFTFTLDHDSQRIGLPVGQHLLMRLRDPVTREAIIRAYTPISDAAAARGRVDVLVKIYRASSSSSSGDGGRHKANGGTMTQALDSIPLGHWVEFKGPVGKFEYLGRGLCTIGGKERRVGRFVMVCGGSGVTPILAVLRAVMGDPDDPTYCLVLDGNRCEEDILCKAEMDALADGKNSRCKVIHTLSRCGDGWKGPRGRMDRGLFEREAGPPQSRVAGGGGDLALVCGPPPLERSVKEIFMDMGWREEDLLFF